MRNRALDDEAWLSLVVAIAVRNNIIAILLFIVVEHDESVADEQTPSGILWIADGLV
jgi:hypothetical protein